MGGGEVSAGAVATTTVTPGSGRAAATAVRKARLAVWTTWGRKEGRDGHVHPPHSPHSGCRRTRYNSIRAKWRIKGRGGKGVGGN